MKKPAITYRAARASDLVPAQEMIMSSFNDLRKKSGMPRIKYKITGPDPWMAHFIKTDPEGAFAAFDKQNRLVGYSQALIREEEWYLGFLFVLPEFQSAGVGGRLLKRAMDYGRRNREIKRWALATFAYNPQAIAIYSKHGMTPQSPLIAMVRKWDEKRPPRPIKGGCTARIVTEIDHKLISRLTAFDRKVRGIARPEEHFMWSDTNTVYPLVFLEGRSILGYCVVTKGGSIGPIAASRPELLKPILISALNYGLVLGHTRQLIQAVGENVEIVRLLMANGFRIEETSLVMASERFADPQRYIPGHLAHY